MAIDIRKKLFGGRKGENISPSVQKTRTRSGGFFDQSTQRTVSRADISKKSGISREPGDLGGVIVTDGSGIGASQPPAPQRDPGKRQRILVVAALVVLFVFGLKVWGQPDWSVEQVVVVAAVAAFLSAVGVAWALRFDVTRIGYLTVIPMPAMFVFGYVLFVEMFFFQRFQRIYEAVMFGALLIIFLMVLGIVFLTANVLNVSTFKKIPLLQVAQTSSYAITLFNVFFIGFFIISLGFMPWFTLPLLLLLYWSASFLHLSHFSIDLRTVVWYSLGIAFSAMCIAGALLIWPVDNLFRVLLPTLVVYIGIGIIMHDVRKALRPLINWEYIIIVVIVVMILLSRAVWGIGGHLWG